MTNEVAAVTQANEFDSALTAAGQFQTQGARLFRDVMNRDGWSAQDSADMRQVASSYGKAADVLAASSAPAEYTWYRDGLVRNYREAVDVAMLFSNLTSASSQSAFDDLVTRWSARVKDLAQLQARLNAQPTPTR